jgi:hypothetical protein
VLTERNRAVLHRRLTDVVGDEEAVSEMLSNFPNDERLRPVTEARLAITEATFEAKLNALGLRLIMWMIGTNIALAGVIVAAIGILT